jgi:hypothetical protein
LNNEGVSKKTASEQINLQHIMELREAFEEADTDKGGELEEDEVHQFLCVSHSSL